MSVTVSDLLKLPSLRQATVIGGHRGLSRIVSSISVLESTDPSVLVDEIFPMGEFFGSEIVITGFLNCLDDVERQCANVRRLAEGGEVGLILFYVGVFLPQVDQRLIDLANEMDFVLIQMPVGQVNLRYGEVISDVSECIYHDRNRGESIVSDILARVSGLPQPQRTINTVLKMLSDLLSASVILTDGFFQVLNLAAWPRNLERTWKNYLPELPNYANGGSVPCPLLPNGHLFHASILPDGGQRVELFLIKEGQPLTQAIQEQCVDVVRLSLNIWGQQHGTIAIRELIRAILQDEPIKMRRLADLFRIPIAAIGEMWILSGTDPRNMERLAKELDSLRAYPESCAEIVFADLYEGNLLFFLSTPPSTKEVERQMSGLLEQARSVEETVTLTRCSGLENPTQVRGAYLCHQNHLEDARTIYPVRQWFRLGELEFAQRCHQLIQEGEAAVSQRVACLTPVQTDKLDWNPVETLSAYLLDSGSSVTQTAERLHLHKNTVKYRIKIISDLLGYHPDRMPEVLKLYQAVAVLRLLR